MNFETRKNIVIGAGSLCIGLGAGYILAQKSLEKKYQAITEHEIQSVRESYRLLRKEDMESLRTIEKTEVTVEETVISDDSFDGPEEPSDEEPEEPTEADVIELRSRVKDLKYWTPPKETEAVRNVRDMLDEEIAKEQEEGDDEADTEPEPSTGSLSIVEAVVEQALGKEGNVNVFDQPTPSADVLGKPHVSPRRISLAEMQQDEQDYSKITLSYYDDDEILADDRDSIINDVDGTVGLDNLKFNGETVIYIRNDELQVDYEICLEMGSFLETKLGIMDDPDDGRSGRG